MIHGIGPRNGWMFSVTESSSVSIRPRPIDHGIVFSNELLDAFPVHRVTLREGRLFELYVGVEEGQNFKWVTGPLSTPRLQNIS